MGSADVVPGVSGGTVALVVGIYRRLIANIRAGARLLAGLLRGRPAAVRANWAAIEWTFLVPLLAGILAALISLAKVIEHQLETNPRELSAFFFGLVAASAWVAWGFLSRPEERHYALALGAGVAAFFVLGLRSGEASDPALWTFFIAGAIAVCAMILPGVSGSFILVMLGMYEAVLTSLNDRDVPPLLLLVAGAIVGLALFSSALHWALDRYHDLVMAAIVGLLIGSLRVLWPWPNGIEGQEMEWPRLSELWTPLVLASVGAVVIVALTIAARRRLPVSDRR